MTCCYYELLGEMMFAGQAVGQSQPIVEPPMIGENVNANRNELRLSNERKRAGIKSLRKEMKPKRKSNDPNNNKSERDRVRTRLSPRKTQTRVLSLPRREELQKRSHHQWDCQ